MSEWVLGTQSGDPWRNIFDLFIDGGEKVPFLVRRGSWALGNGMALCVVKVNPKQTRTGVYGTAYGYMLPNAIHPEWDKGGYYGSKGHVTLIPCCGCYEWRRIDKNR
jgi:hypothetical protein